MAMEARKKGVTGVPFTIINGRWAVSGGQTSEVYGQVRNAKLGSSSADVLRFRSSASSPARDRFTPFLPHRPATTADVRWLPPPSSRNSPPPVFIDSFRTKCLHPVSFPYISSDIHTVAPFAFLLLSRCCTLLSNADPVWSNGPVLCYRMLCWASPCIGRWCFRTRLLDSIRNDVTRWRSSMSVIMQTNPLDQSYEAPAAVRWSSRYEPLGSQICLRQRDGL